MNQDALQIGIWVISAGVILNLILSGLRIWMILAQKPERREVRVTGTCLDRKDFESHVQQNRVEHEEIFQQIGDVQQRSRDDLRRDIGSVHDKINAVAREVSALTAAQELEVQQLARMDVKLDQIFCKRAP